MNKSMRHNYQWKARDSSSSKTYTYETPTMANPFVRSYNRGDYDWFVKAMEKFDEERRKNKDPLNLL